MGEDSSESDGDVEERNQEEPDVIVEKDDSSVDQLNRKLPDGVYLDEDEQELNFYDNSVDSKDMISQIGSLAKSRSSTATLALAAGGVTLGIFISGSTGGAAGATFGSIIGALYDEGYIEFGEDGLELNIGGETEYITSGEDAELVDPLEVHEDKWYRPDSEKYQIAIELPSGDRRYYKTKDGAANRLPTDAHQPGRFLEFPRKCS